MIYGFNETCSNIAANCLKVGDDSMSTIRFLTLPKRDLPLLSYIFCKLEPVSFGVRSHICLYQEIYGGDKGAGAEVLERVNKGSMILG